MSLSRNVSKNNLEASDFLHPLEQNNSEAVKCIRFVTLDYVDQYLMSPIPRHQELPNHAFGDLNENSVLVAISHGWFYQCHPDPEGYKLRCLKSLFIPKLRHAFPDTNILFFYDYLASPQRPRTIREEIIFKKAMKHMNSIYIYCDVVIFLETETPQPDRQIRSGKTIGQDNSVAISMAGMRPRARSNSRTYRSESGIIRAKD